MGNLYAVIDGPKVVRHSRGAVVHLEALAWDRTARSALEACARGRYARASAAGRLCARVTDLLEERELPRLPEDIYWTRALLADLLTLKGQFALLGNARDAYVPIPNPVGIETLADLLGALLARDYDGACSLEQLEDDLRQAGVIRKRLTPTMLGDGQRVCMRGSTVLLTGLADNA